MDIDIEHVLSLPLVMNPNNNNNNNDINIDNDVDMLLHNNMNTDIDNDAHASCHDNDSMSSSIHTIHVNEEEIGVIDEEVEYIAEQTNHRSTAIAAAMTPAGSIMTTNNNIDPAEVDTLLAKEIDGLSFQERNDIYEEIHGVSNMAAKETPELLQDSLRRMSEEIEKLVMEDNGNGSSSSHKSDFELKRAYEIATNVVTAKNNAGATEADRQRTARRNKKIDDNFRLRFLRCDLLNPKLAARRLCTFYDLIQSFYGVKGLEKFVSILTNTNTNTNTNNTRTGTGTGRNGRSSSKQKNSSSNKKKSGSTLMDFFLEKRTDMIAFRCGYIQLLPFRDRSGRKILVFVLDALKLESVIRLKIWLYMIFVASEDVETQRNGVVIIFWPGSDKNITIPRSKHRSLVRKIFNGIPTRCASFHFCFPNTPFFHIMRSILALTLTPMRERTRVKLHMGERVEVQYELMGYGIPIELLPTTETGRLKTKNCTQWIKARKLLEGYTTTTTTTNNTTTTSTNTVNRTQKQQQDDNDNDTATVVIRIDCPGVNDVIFRSAGKSCMNNPGNVVFRGYFEMYHDEHVVSNQTTKKNIIWSIVEEIERRDGKFLNWEKEGGWWTPIHDRNEIRSKVAISFRDYNKQRRAVTQTNQQIMKSSTYAFIRQDGSKNKRRKSITTKTHTCTTTSSTTTGGAGGNRSNCINSNNSDGTSSEDEMIFQQGDHHDRSSCSNNNDAILIHNNNENGDGDDCFLCGLTNCIKN